MKLLDPQLIRFIAIHASDTKPHQDITAADIDRWHRAKGWAKIGYHRVIRRSGEQEEGRMLHQLGMAMAFDDNLVVRQGAHVADWNHNSVGICLIGGRSADGERTEDNFTPQQFDTLEDILWELTVLFPHAAVVGHRDFPNVKKDCPCFDVLAWLKTRAIWSVIGDRNHGQAAFS